MANTIKPITRRIAALRDATGGSNKKFAKKVGLPEVYTSRYCNGGRRMQVAHLASIASHLGIPTDYLIFGDTTHLSNKWKKRLDI